MCRLQFYRNIQKKSTNPSIRTLVSTLQCRFLCVFRILPYTHSANGPAVFYCIGNSYTIKKRSARIALRQKRVVSLKRPAAGGESREAGFLFIQEIL